MIMELETWTSCYTMSSLKQSLQSVSCCWESMTIQVQEEPKLKKTYLSANMLFPFFWDVGTIIYPSGWMSVKVQTSFRSGPLRSCPVPSTCSRPPSACFEDTLAWFWGLGPIGHQNHPLFSLFACATMTLKLYLVAVELATHRCCFMEFCGWMQRPLLMLCGKFLIQGAPNMLNKLKSKTEK